MQGKYSYKIERFFRIISLLNLVFLGITLFSCTKTGNEVGGADSSKSVLKIKITGIEEHMDTKSAFSVNSKNDVAISDVDNSVVENWDDFSVAISGREQSYYEQQGALSSGFMGERKLGANVRMQDLKKYRILLYDKVNNSLVANVQGIAGEETEITVSRNRSYIYYAYSYNDENDIPNTSSSATPIIHPSLASDFIYATDEINANQKDQPLFITFHRQFIELSMEIDTEEMIGTVSNVNASFAPSTVLYQPTEFDVKTGQFTGTTVYNPGNFVFEPHPTDPKKLVKKFYTVRPATPPLNYLRTYAIDINSLTLTYEQAGQTKVKNYTNAVGTKRATFGSSSNFNPTVGKILLGTLKMWKVFPAKRILHWSGNTTYGYSAFEKASRLMLDNGKNFCKDADCIVKVNGFVHEGIATITAGQLATRLSNSNLPTPDIIVIGVYSSFNASDITALTAYVQNKGILFLMTDPAGAVNHDDFLNSLFNVTSVTRDVIASAGAMYRLRNISDPILEGPFGDIRNKFWGEDSNSTYQLRGLPANTYIEYSNGDAVNRAAPANVGITMFRHNTYNFMWLGDGGFLANEYNFGVYVSDAVPSMTTQPFTTNSNFLPIQRVYGNGTFDADVPTNIRFNQNSIVFANFMAWAVERAEFHGINSSTMFN